MTIHSAAAEEAGPTLLTEPICDSLDFDFGTRVIAFSYSSALLAISLSILYAQTDSAADQPCTISGKSQYVYTSNS